MAVRECEVSFIDEHGITHRVTVNAQTVLEAAALGKCILQEQGTLDNDTAYELTVEIVTRTIHKVPGVRLHNWLHTQGRDPKTQALKARLR